MDDLLAALDPSSDATAVITPDGHAMTHAQVVALGRHVQDQIDEIGITPGHRIAVLLGDVWAYPILLTALVGRCSVLPLNPALTDGELQDIASAAGVSAVLAAPGCPQAARLVASLSCGVLTLTASDRALELAQNIQPLQALEMRDAGLVLLTSGTTGLPKRVPITPAAMVQSAKTIAETLHLSPDDRALHALPMFHIGAVVDLFLAPLMAGGSCVIAQGKAPADIDDALSRHGATWAQLVPTMLSRCLSDLPPSQLSLWVTKLRFLRSVSSDLTAEAQASAEAALGGLAIVAMYGMTETAGQICSNPAPPDGPRRPGTVGPPTGVQIALLDSVGAPVPDGQIGEVCVKGPTVTAGYEDAPRDGMFWADYLRTGDLGQFDDAGYLRLTGRIKEMINRGGEKISPLEVERVSLALSGVREAAAYALPHPTYGEQVGLTVVAEAVDEAAILSHLRGRLAEHKRPRHVDIRAVLPRLGSGKVDRRALARPRDTAAPAVYATPTARIVADLWAATLGTAPRDDDDFFDAGGDSLQATTFLIALEEALARPVDPNLLYEAPRFADLITALDTAPRRKTPKEPAFVTFLRKQTAGWKGARVGKHGLIVGQRLMGVEAPVILITQGENTPFLNVLHPGRPVYLLRTLRHMFGKSDAMTQDLAEIYADDLAGLIPDGPMHIVGFCEGAKLGHYIAETLKARGRVSDVFVSVDYPWPRPWPGAVLHVQSESYQQFRAPAMGLGHLTTGGADVVLLSGAHAAALHGPSMPALGTRMEALFSGAETLPRHPAPMDLTARAALYHARLRLSGPRRFSRHGGPITLQVGVTNASGQDWGPTQESGIALAADIVNLDGYLRRSAAGHATLDTSLPAGATTHIPLTIHCPDRFVPLRLRVAMTDEGICRFVHGRDTYVTRLIWPFG